MLCASPHKLSFTLKTIEPEAAPQRHRTEVRMKRESFKVRETAALVSLLFRCGGEPPDFALARLDALLQLLEKSDRPAFLSFRGAFFALKGDREASAQCHQAAIAAEPDGHRAYIRYAESLSYLKDYDAAIRMYEQAAGTVGNEEPERRLAVLNGLLFTACLAGITQNLDHWLEAYESLAGEAHGIAAQLRDGCVLERDCCAVQCYAAACSSGAFKDWEHPDEDEAWKHLQWAT